mgnify:FL=1
MMGFNYDDCDRGMEFTYVQQNMPLAAAGVVAGDLLVSINGAPITCVADFTAYQTEHPFDGSAVTLEYEHSGKTKEITVTPVEKYVCECTVFVSAPGETVPDRRAEIQRAGDQILGAHRH